ncbi:MAG: nicotinamide riboside transporter PnuC [Fluviicoccus sp.]|uniref:nicotinamide riboside transporter PnuC n=1 Tax=Fluviicoccus sp. TaxID=2003552 RepID=UPI0027165718|nr:nicotinamide riboside transporter PnuC [Fluviicoccus sp.]MDO8332041.1 nicotinamide riboside transporter PnuC [Fluviicoccus sp.]
MNDLLLWLNQSVEIFPGTRLSGSEIAGFATGLWCVWLTLRKSIWNFPVGIANCTLLLWLFWESRLFADAGLQIMFIVLGALGWHQWLQGKTGPELPVGTLSQREWRNTAIITGLLILSLFSVLTVAKGSIPVFDALITALSLVAQWLLNRRKLENWIFWIGVDLISVPVYAYKQLYLIAGLYAVFLLLCVRGYRSWKHDLDVSKESAKAGL